MWQLWDRRIWSLVTHDTTWHEHLLTLCPCAKWGRGKQHGCLFRLAMHFLSSVVLSLEFSECLGAGSRRSLRYHFYIRVPHQDKWRKTWHVWDPINHGIKKTTYQRVQDSSHQQCALLSLISHSSCRMLTAPFARAKLLQGRFLAMTLEILCCSQSHLGLQEVQKPRTYCQKARLLHSFVHQFFFESCRAELKLLFNRDIKSEEKAGFQGELLFFSRKNSNVIFATLNTWCCNSHFGSKNFSMHKLGRSEANLESQQSPNDEVESEDVEIEQGRFVCQPSWFMPTPGSKSVEWWFLHYM